jgi:hypothetical protein
VTYPVTVFYYTASVGFLRLQDFRLSRAIINVSNNSTGESLMRVGRVMATRKTDPVGGGEKQGKIEIAYVKLEGNDATLQEAVKAFSALINRQATNGAVLSAAKRVNALPARTNGATGQEPVDDQLDLLDTEQVGTPEEVTEPTETSPRQAKKTGPMKYPEPKLLDIDFNAPAVSLKEFLKGKAQKSHNEKFLVIGAWFREHGGAEDVTSDHVYSAYRAMNWKSRKNMLQPFYFLQGKGWVTKTDSGWRMTHIGLDEAKKAPSTGE